MVVEDVRIREEERVKTIQLHSDEGNDRALTCIRVGRKRKHLRGANVRGRQSEQCDEERKERERVRVVRYREGRQNRELWPAEERPDPDRDRDLDADVLGAV